MDASASRPYQRHADDRSGMRPSPPESTDSSPQAMNPPRPNAFSLAPAARIPGLSAPLPQIGPRSPGAYNAPSYSHSYGTSSTSPSTASGSLQEGQLNEPPNLPPAGMSPTQMSVSSLNAQKRAYRQRRKDPSCDACRERKVKCDATETTACSECSTRNHKCQFTKETNRRMSSIKQVQDLQSQLDVLRQENTQLRTKVSPDKSAVDMDRGPVTSFHLESQPISQTAAQRIPPPMLNNFDHVRKNIRAYSREIFHAPYEGRAEYLPPAAVPDIPPRAHFAHLSRAYLASIHELYPVLHWPTFQREADEVYTSRSFQDKTKEWIGLFFAVLACGSLQTPGTATGSPSSRPAGMELYEIAKQLVDPSSQELNIVHAQAALLLSIYATESNLRSAGLAWAASAVRIAQVLGLQCGTRSWPIIEGEVRRRLWWSIYVWDRMLSLGSNYPALINEDDCETPLPSPIEDRYIQAQGFTRPSSTQPPFTGFLAVIQVTRLFSQLYQTTKPSIMTSQVLQSWNEKFHSVMLLFPESYDLGTSARLEPEALVPLLTLQQARFHLYRHNMSPVCRPPERAEALRRCTSVAQDTAKYISRTLHAQSARPESDRSWHAMVTSITSHSICLHLWRCMLMLCFRSDFDAALMCLHLASAIGSLRKINSACGKHLSFFLDHLLDRTRGGSDAHHLEHDEEMLAYVSADMQGDLEHAWVWNNTGMIDYARGPTSPAGSTSTPTRGSMEITQNAHLPLRPGTGSSENGIGVKDWDDWGRVEQMMRQLMEEHRARLAQPPSYYSTSHNPVKRVQLAPEAPKSPTRLPVSSGASRISIAKLI